MTENCRLCGEPREAHTKNPADWRTEPGCTGLFYKKAEPDGLIARAEQRLAVLDAWVAKCVMDTPCSLCVERLTDGAVIRDLLAQLQAADTHREALTRQVQAIRALVNAQAEDGGLWFIARTAPEAYLQQGLRKLHEAIELAADTGRT